MKFEVGDKVKVKPFSELEKLLKKNATRDGDGDWDYEYKQPDGNDGDIYFIREMKLACEEVAKVIFVDEDYGTYDLKFEHDIFSDEGDYQFIDDWLEKPKESGYVADFSGKPDTVGEIFNELLPRLEEMFREVYNRGYENGKTERL